MNNVIRRKATAADHHISSSGKGAFVLLLSILLLSACSKSGEPVVDPPVGPEEEAQTFTASVGLNTNTPQTKATIIYQNANIEAGEQAIWNAGDTFEGYMLRADGATDNTPFAIEANYSDNTPSASARFTTEYAGTPIYVMAAYPSGKFTKDNIFTPTETELAKYDFTVPATQTQTGANTDHVKALMMMYGGATPDGTNISLNFRHATAILRLTLKNERTAPVKLKSVKVSCGAAIFCTTGYLKLLKEASGYRCLSYAGTGTTSALTLNMSDYEWSNGNIIDGYLLTLPGLSMENQTLTFKVTITDSDGSNERTYTSLSLNANEIINANNGTTVLEAGKRYRIGMKLREELTIGTISVDDWSTGTGIDEGEALQAATVDPTTHTLTILNPEAVDEDYFRTAVADAIGNNSTNTLILKGSVTANIIRYLRDWAIEERECTTCNLSVLDMSGVTGLTELPSYAFSRDDNESISSLTSITLPNSITAINNSAFAYCYGLTKFSGSGVTSIGNYAFSGCNELSEFSAPKVTVIDDNAFESCKKLATFTSTNVTSLGNYAFTDCISLSEFNGPTVTFIDESAFNNCTSLSEFNGPKVTFIGNNAFNGCSKLTALTFTTADNITVSTEPSEPFDNYITKNIDLILNGNKLGDNMWNSYTWKSITYIYPAMTVNVTNHTLTVTDPSKVDKTNFQSNVEAAIGTDGPNTLTLKGSVTADMIYYLRDWAIPKSDDNSPTCNLSVLDMSGVTGLTAIPDNAFSTPDHKVVNTLTTITLPSSITSIGNYAFAACSKLPALTVPNVTSIGDFAFAYCKVLTNFSGPAVTSIGEFAFTECIALANFSGPAVTSIGSSVFSGCITLTAVSFTATDGITVNNDSFGSDKTSSINLELNQNKKNEVTSTNIWKGFTWKEITYKND